MAIHISVCGRACLGLFSDWALNALGPKAWLRLYLFGDFRESGFHFARRSYFPPILSLLFSVHEKKIS